MHKELKEIAKIIGYNKEISEKYDVKVYIFTTEFIDKLGEYRSIKQEDKTIIGTKKHQDWQDCFNNILEHLDDPVSYLYNLLGGTTNK